MCLGGEVARAALTCSPWIREGQEGGGHRVGRCHHLELVLQLVAAAGAVDLAARLGAREERPLLLMVWRSRRWPCAAQPAPRHLLELVDDGVVESTAAWRSPPTDVPLRHGSCSLASRWWIRRLTGAALPATGFVEGASAGDASLAFASMKRRRRPLGEITARTLAAGSGPPCASTSASRLEERMDCPHLVKG